MRVRIYGAIVAKPIKFPDELEMRILPLHKDGGISLGVSYTMDEIRTWDWVRNRYPLTQEGEERIKGGEAIEVFRGSVVTGCPDGTEFPVGSDVTILDD
jgi:hypothetical protein